MRCIMKILNFLLIVWLVILVPKSGLTKGIQLEEGYGYFELGWSADGKRFAYASFFKKHYSDNVPTPEYDYSDLKITIIDLVSDQTLWTGGQQWKEGNPVYPTSIYAAMEHLPQDVFSSLKSYSIQSVDPRPLNLFPIENGDFLTVEVREKELQSYSSSYEFYAVSGNLGEKKIFSFEAQSQKLGDISILGYSMNPDKSRIAVFIYVLEGGYDGQIIDHTDVTGCHLKAGFKKVVY